MYKLIDHKKATGSSSRLQFSSEYHYNSGNSVEHVKSKQFAKNRSSKSKSVEGSCEKRNMWTPKTKTARKSQDVTKSLKKTRSISIVHQPRTYKKKKPMCF